TFSLSASLTGTSGADLIVGTHGNDVIDGLAGNDILIGSGGNDTIRGGEGNDTYVYSFGDGRDTIFDTSGIDHLSLDQSAIDHLVAFQRVGDDLRANFSDDGSITWKNHFAGNTLESIDTPNGSIDTATFMHEHHGGEQLTGNDDANVLVGDDGDDTIIGGGG